MSVKISNKTIIMTRGDTLKLKVNITDSLGNPYTPVDGDSLKFGVKNDYNDEETLILKDIPIDTCLLHLAPSDTKSLKQPSKLVYDFELTKADGTVDTFLSGVLKITEEVI